MPTIQAAIENILTAIPGAPFAETVDVIKAGDPSQVITGIVTTFLGNCEVLQKAVDKGANFIITHEPIFYNHLDETDWLKDDSVYRAKRKLIEDHGLVVWRFHDYWHSHQPDGIMIGVARALGWEAYRDPSNDYLYHIPPTPVEALFEHVTAKLGSHRAQMVARPGMTCRNVSLQVGSPGGRWQIGALSQDIDLLITGEINEWETCEYVRDALFQGLNKGVIVLGHEVSEEAGMAYLAEWLRPRFPNVEITHIASGDPF